MLHDTNFERPPVLMDFGEAVHLDEWEFAYIDGYGPGGATAFLAPEIMGNLVRNGRLNYAKNDVFALGMTMYFMLAGLSSSLQPFDTSEPRDYAMTSYQELSAAYDADIRAVVRDMLQPAMEDRLSATELRDRVMAMGRTLSR